MIKTTELHPSLTEEDLKPYLLRSRAASAYDAVTLLARSVGVAFDLGGDNCTSTSVIQVALDQAFLVHFMNTLMHSVCKVYFCYNIMHVHYCFLVFVFAIAL